VITALTWFDLKIKAFSPKDITHALDHIGVRAGERKRLWNELKTMEPECGRIEIFRTASAALDGSAVKQPSA